MGVGLGSADGEDELGSGEGFAKGVGEGGGVSVELGDGSELIGGTLSPVKKGDSEGDGEGDDVASCARTFGAIDATVITTIATASKRKTRREVDPPLNDIPDLRLNV